MANNSFRLRLVREGSEFEAEGSEAFIEKMLTRHWAQGAVSGGKPPPAARAGRTEKRTTAKGESVAEFVRRVGGARKHTDLVLLFGYYLEKFAGMEDFSAADVNNSYYEAKLDRSNTSQMLIQNIRAGRVMGARGGTGGRRRYRLTRSGERAVEEMIKSAAEAE
jgi:hypothetical protein